MSTELFPTGHSPSRGPLPNSAADFSLRAFYRQEFERVHRDFDATGSGLASLSDRTRLVDVLALKLWDQSFSPGPHTGYTLIAVGGYGRSELFPHSDIDLLFLAEDAAAGERIREAVSRVCQQMWDLGLRVSPATRTLGDCSRLDQGNLEFTLSLLDCRFLAGDVELFERLHERRLPEVVGRESDALLQSLWELTQLRHQRFGNTIFHLEPNLKDGPGGLRDCHVSQWIGMILALASGRKSELLGVQQNPVRTEILEAAEFLSSARCYLHYRHNRDDNSINWGAQEDLAARGIGTGTGPVSPAEWMRLYFRHAKTVYRSNSQLLNQVTQNRSSLYRSFQQWRSRISNADFSVVDGQIYLQQAGAARDVATVLRLFSFMAQHGVALSADTERRITSAHGRLVANMPRDKVLWQYLREILTFPHAAAALRAMHSLRLLTYALPEFEAVDLLVLRDLYHRYTVDEHTFLAIETLHQLNSCSEPALRPFGSLLEQVERPELLFLALLLHDTGKGLEGVDHVHSSLQLTRAAVDRLNLSEDDAKMVCFLVADHLEISATLRRRDIYDPAAIAELAEKLATPERLKALTLLTLADIKAVNPEAMTPWKAENLWRLYTATSNYFDRNADTTPFNANAAAEAIEKVILLEPRRRTELLRFLDRLPQRYLLSHSSEEMVQHFNMSTRLSAEPVQLQLQPDNGQYALTVVTTDRAGLFRMLSGVLYGWGMDITKAAAFSNRSGVVVDCFYFKDRFRTLELNPTERERFKRSITEILMGEAPLEQLLESRLRSDQQPVKLTVETRLRFNDECSARNTLLEVVTQDRPGLLHILSSTLTTEGCNIEVALIDTEGPLAHDVFYLTCNGKKLTPDQVRSVEWALATDLADSLPWF